MPKSWKSRIVSHGEEVPDQPSCVATRCETMEVADLPEGVEELLLYG